MPTKVQCSGCQQMFTARAHALHLSQTENPRCRALYAAIDGYLPGADESESDSDEGKHGESNHRDLSPRMFEGDLFGDASRYHDNDFPGLWSDEDGGHSDLGQETSSDSETDDDRGETSGWEPPPATVTPARPAQDEDMEEYGRLLTPQERQNAERNLRAQHFVNHFPSPRAGELVRNASQAGYAEYSEQLLAEEDTNPYYPFLSKVDWEFARWAKLRGPSSTATTELLGINGVSKYVFQCTSSNKMVYRYMKLLGFHTRIQKNSTNLLTAFQVAQNSSAVR